MEQTGPAAGGKAFFRIARRTYLVTRANLAGGRKVRNQVIAGILWEVFSSRFRENGVEFLPLPSASSTELTPSPQPTSRICLPWRSLKTQKRNCLLNRLRGCSAP